MNAPEKFPLFDLSDWSARQLAATEQALSRWVAHPVDAPAPAGLGDAMRYAVLDGGKRLRPLLVMAACDAVNGTTATAVRAACAVELIHAYSLVHDDMPCVGLPLTSGQLHEMHRLKTGALLQASVMMGAACGTASPVALKALQTYGAAVGLAFQVVDDILDVTADAATLGKTAGKDAAQDKPTFVSLMGLQASREYAQQLLAQALVSLQASGLEDTHALQALADMLVNRQH